MAGKCGALDCTQSLALRYHPISNDGVPCQANLGETCPPTLLILEKRHFALLGSL
jgi:hypothetical protein